ncbi:molybdenum cofactor biosynthesis protein MoaE [Tunicatimonas pelagia]|uniref:molybdenum cofactor biosynthesis protein MoaE n=1 Tax=Tunicatimonas pelagia TaxID=931531 RepID=UPI00266516A0|nr:molybdenum cofactor biosynthesis protein MoaE [Tunicatimonas pelagia]WKN46211.1 molybdenum cofactor biosynthesis protein MoaE [Tunicatimonas pelagia]
MNLSQKISISLTDDPLQVDKVLSLVQSDGAGAVDVFIGTVRNNTQQRTVKRLDFEAYDPMAAKEMEKLAQRACEQWPVEKIAIHHRKGTLYIGDIAVIIAVATPHRQAAFEACKFTIDTLKQTVPIWKKEIFDDGEVWVSAHP